MAFRQFGLNEGAPVVNWCGMYPQSLEHHIRTKFALHTGFYLDSCLFPPKSTQPSSSHEDTTKVLLLGPFCGKPACQYIRAKTGGGVCADAYLSREVLVVPDVESYPGHIACDGSTRSEVVLPMKLKRKIEGTDEMEDIVLGVMDLDSIVPVAFDDDDKQGLMAIVTTLVEACDW